MVRWGALAALVLLLAGCSSPGERAPADAAAPIGSGATESASSSPPLMDNRTPDPGPALPSTLLTWSNCAAGAAAFTHHAESARPLVPPGYVQTNVAGQVGYNSLLAFRCSGAQALDAYAADAGLALYGINVQAPPGLDAPDRTNLYLLHLVHDDGLTAALAGLVPAALPGAVGVLESAWTVDAAGGRLASVETVADSSPQPDATQLWRLHWVADGRACYADAEIVFAEEARNEALLTAEGGAFQTVAGPAPRMAGVSRRAHADGALAMPVCPEVAE